MTNIMQMMKQAQQMQSKMQEFQKSLDLQEVTGQSGSGAISITVNGHGRPKTIKIEKSVVDPNDVEMLEDLILAALNDAKDKLDKMIQDETGKMMGDMNLPPGMKLPF